ncbi:kinesin-like protein KIF2A isoform X2 [Daktulosphaira vitifoliae]|uniref:kinesin-like protein KIF2A isoform X2 n=1 Tax=Daktulosphaira vitifoliae TaxID=58002 RepID=UPI0021AAE70B|nr:kinesin-like protein KIF2A isoform X2 [Daktulosphaira vitifoliae]
MQVEDGYFEGINLKLAMDIKIKRTDGRVHKAVVSRMNPDTRSISVEWLENGETKGKEIDLDGILELNPQLRSNIPTINMVAQNGTNIPTTSKLARYSTKASIQAFTNNKGSFKGSKPVTRQTNHYSPAVNGSGEMLSTTVPCTPLNPPSQYQQIPVLKPADPPPQTQQLTNLYSNNTNRGITNSTTTAAAVAAAAAKDRRSNVVKEVAKLKKNREERRQRQAELKEEKEALMNMDPGNPNWEFLAMIRDYQSNLDFKPLRDNELVEDHQITVCVRKRPLNKKELNRKEVDVIAIPTKNQVIVHEPKNKVDLTKYLENQHFRFDYAFDETCTNETVYKYSAKPLVKTIFDGGMATCFAYGQTGSGKTHTMGGDFHGKTQDCKKGIYAMAAKDVFRFLNSPSYGPLNLVVTASFFEIYSGKVFDLLGDKAKLRVLEDGMQKVQVVGLTEKVVTSVDEVLKLINDGNSARTSGQTSANSNSSRSHAVFQIVLRIPGLNQIHGKFSLIDLAGNERGADTSSANRQTRMEGAEINKSLLALKECIRALGKKGSHLPFRASKLTQVLRDSFVGENSKTCMIAMISPGLSSCEHSLNTLRYADRVKELDASDPVGGETQVPTFSPATNHTPNISRNLQDVSMVDDDLAALRSLNEAEISPDLYNFQQAVSQLQEQEDDMLDKHKALLDASQKWLQKDKQLLGITRNVDYDVDAYSLQLLNLLQDKLAVTQDLMEIVVGFRKQLTTEEQFSQNMRGGHR